VSEIKAEKEKNKVTLTFSAIDSSDDVTVDQKAGITSARLKIARLKAKGDLRPVFEQITRIAARVLDVKRVGIWFINDETDELIGECIYDARERSKFTTYSLKKSDFPKYCQAVKSMRFLDTSNAGNDELTSELKSYCESMQVKALLDAAIYRNGEVVGMVCHEYIGEGTREWLPEQRQFAATVADMVSNYIEVHERMMAEAVAHEFELALKDSQRLDALGRLSAGVAHDINGLLAVVNNAMSLLMSSTEPSQIEARKMVRESVDHVAVLTNHLLMLGRKQLTKPELHDAAELIEQTRRLIETQLGDKWKVVYDASNDLTLWADATQFYQVMVNLIVNAAQSMESGGTVAVRMRKSSARDRVVIDVIDAGSGISAANLKSIFVPFFSTKNNGYGLGLAVVEQLVHLHGGTVRVSSKIGDGTTFHILWPSEPR
jgi:two-component system, cell cycle sensor histidine kinase and response regulator CckA